MTRKDKQTASAQVPSFPEKPSGCATAQGGWVGGGGARGRRHKEMGELARVTAMAGAWPHMMENVETIGTG